MLSKIKNLNINTKFALVAIFAVSLFIFHGISATNYSFFINLRAKKILAVILVSFAAGYSSVVFQTITSNKILTPGIMGLDSLYMFIQTCIVFFFQGKQLTAMEGNGNFILSAIAMIGFSWILYFLIFRGSQKNVYFLVLTGMVFGTLFGGLADFMQVLLDPNEFLVLQGKMFASFGSINVELLGISVVLCIVCFLVTFRDYKKLDVISIGVDHSINLGVDYKHIVMKNLMVISVLTSISTVLVGPVAFLGIMVVSVARKFVNSYRHDKFIYLSVMTGIIALVSGLFLVERVLDMATSLGVIINFVGGIFFIVYMIKEGKNDRG